MNELPRVTQLACGRAGLRCRESGCPGRGLGAPGLSDLVLVGDQMENCIQGHKRGACHLAEETREH